MTGTREGGGKGAGRGEVQAGRAREKWGGEIKMICEFKYMKLSSKKNV
jgi:hypothetical protein